MATSALDQVELHFTSEEKLLEQFEALNRQIHEAFDGIGLKNLTPDQIGSIGETTNVVQQGLDELQQNREVLLTQLNDSTDSAYSDFAQLLNETSSPRAEALKQRWAELLGRAMRARATFESNQMTLLYSVEYCQRFVAGLIEISNQNDRYGRRPGEQSHISGNLVRKNC